MRLMNRAFETALITAQNAEDPRIEIMILKTRGEIRRHWGEFKGSIEDYQQALERTKAFGITEDQASILRGLAELAIVEGSLFKQHS